VVKLKAVPQALTGQQWSGTQFVDAYKRNRQPTPNELMAELKNTAWACISLNSAVCANNPPQLYVTTDDGQKAARCRTRALSPRRESKLRQSKHLPGRFTKSARIDEVADHPLMALLSSANPVHNSFDLWELTTLYQEVHGSCYWYLPTGPLGIPSAIWILPAQNVTPKRKPDSTSIVDYYQYRTGTREQIFSPDEIIHFRYPDPRDPYTGGLSPLRACIEQVALMSDYAAMKKAI
jgi:Phage portal protein